MFDIHLLSSSELGPDGQRLGRITIGDFTERFVCHSLPGVSVDEMPKIWKEQLRSLTQGASAVALVHEPRFAWILYREGEHCFVQQRLAIDGCFDSILPRETVNEDGDRISEWPVSLQAILKFVTE